MADNVVRALQQPSLGASLLAFIVTVLVLALSYQLLVIFSLYIHAAIQLGGIVALSLRAPPAIQLLPLGAAVIPALLIVLPLTRRPMRLMPAIGLGVAIGLVVYATGAIFGVMPEYTLLTALNILAGNETGMLPFVVPAGGFGAAAAWAILSRGFKSVPIISDAPKRNWRR